jgi:signal transduction histidine kinase/DNA-binding response OmpR family regulator/HPt (histidine-containing phosphotransfer) domain-containing protein
MTQAPELAPANSILNRTQALFKAQQEGVYKRTDRVFAGLMLFQWAASVVTALCVSPLAWEGTASSVHLHVWAAVLVGGAITLFPVCLALTRQGRAYTRHIIAASQMLMSALLIHLSGGRIETHFHVFGSLAILAFYRDWRVLLTASLVVAIDHALRGIFWPQSVYGILTIEPWRWVEHAGWVTFIDIFLIISIRESLKTAWEIAHRQAELEGMNRTVERKVIERTAELESEISERKHAQADLSQTNVKLKALSKDLLQSRDQAVQASRFKSEFLANMSHEIRTPLNAVVGISDLLMRTRLTDEQREFGAIINNSADVLLGIINDILDYSKIESGRLDLEIIDFDIVDLVEGAAELVAERARSKQLSLCAYIDPQIPSMLRGDSGRIRQVLLNFLSNAIKFTDRGEIVISAVKQRTEGDGTVKVCFAVKDTGIGLSKSARERLFQPFTQADSTVTRRYGGTGLGLAISKRLVELMNGNIEFDSVYGEGSEFSFTVELETCAHQLESEPPVVAARVLLVDGPEGTQQILSSYIDAWGMRSSSATDVDKAIVMLRREAAANDPYHLVLVAFEPDNLEPLTLLREIRPYQQLSSTRLVVIGSSADREFGQQALRDGFSAYLQLPVRQQTLRECIFNLTAGTQVSTTADTPSPDEAVCSKPVPEPEPRNLVLVVEDNPANQKVALLQLREMGLAAHAVGNGMEALEAVARTQYALILMDCQMPEMDGFQATAEIRKMEALTGKHSPIIAMTALAMSNDRVQCLAAGMDDYISKPVSQKKLVELLARWLPKFHSSSQRADQAADAPGGLPRPIELAVLQATFGVEVASELLRDFDHDVERLLKQIAEGIEQRDVSAIKHSAHELKGESASLYATEMSELSRALEDLVMPEDVNWTAVEAGLKMIRQAFLRVQQVVAKMEP